MTNNLIEVNYSKINLKYELSLLSKNCGVIAVKKDNINIGYINMSDIEMIIKNKKSILS